MFLFQRLFLSTKNHFGKSNLARLFKDQLFWVLFRIIFILTYNTWSLRAECERVVNILSLNMLHKKYLLKKTVDYITSE